MSDYHTSVLLNEAIEYLCVQPGRKYIDSTLGGGGHSLEIIKRGGVVLGLDVDQDAIRQTELRIKNYELRIKEQLILTRGNFRDIKRIAEEKEFDRVSGILFDLGVSSHQFDTAEKGFSFQKDAPLDMRMDSSLSVTAADLVNALTKEELAALFVKYGEEQYAKRIAQAILEQRKKKRIETTKELTEIIVRVYPKKSGDKKEGIHPATKVFQALRIAVNDELNSLQDALQDSIGLLQPNGRIVVISFHSLEDRIVKHTFIDFEKQKKGEVLTRKPIIPIYEEIETNRRSRSAKLRVFQKS